MSKPTVYFDYNATTPLDGKVREAMLPFLGDVFGNPSSVHHIGRKARALLDEARERVAQNWVCKPSEVVFTSGGTESSNLAIFGAARLRRHRGRHLITSTIEHHAVLHSCEYLAKKEGFDVTYMAPGPSGQIDPNDLVQALRPDTILVSIMAANNEIGTIQPVAECGRICRERGILFHTDAVQWFGKLPFTTIHQFHADLVSVCAHKFHGPKGAGALFIRSPLLPDPIIFGGGHENERRAGTENVAGIIGFTDATERFVRNPVFPAASLEQSTSILRRALTDLPSTEGIQGLTVRGLHVERLPNTVAFTVRGTDSIALLAALDLEGFCASSGSACSAGSVLPSHVLLALGVPRDEASSLVRISFGRENTSEELAAFLKVLPPIVARCQRFNP